MDNCRLRLTLSGSLMESIRIVSYDISLALGQYIFDGDPRMAWLAELPLTFPPLAALVAHLRANPTITLDRLYREAGMGMRHLDRKTAKLLFNKALYLKSADRETITPEVLGFLATESQQSLKDLPVIEPSRVDIIEWLTKNHRNENLHSACIRLGEALLADEKGPYELKYAEMLAHETTGNERRVDKLTITQIQIRAKRSVIRAFLKTFHENIL